MDDVGWWRKQKWWRWGTSLKNVRQNWAVRGASRYSVFCTSHSHLHANWSQCCSHPASTSPHQTQLDAKEIPISNAFADERTYEHMAYGLNFPQTRTIAATHHHPPAAHLPAAHSPQNLIPRSHVSMKQLDALRYDSTTTSAPASCISRSAARPTALPAPSPAAVDPAADPGPDASSSPQTALHGRGSVARRTNSSRGRACAYART